MNEGDPIRSQKFQDRGEIAIEYFDIRVHEGIKENTKSYCPAACSSDRPSFLKKRALSTFEKLCLQAFTHSSERVYAGVVITIIQKEAGPPSKTRGDF